MNYVSLKDVSVTFPIYKSKPNAKIWEKMIGTGLDMHEFDALRDISFELKGGDRLALLGKNGSGKSTLLKVLAGALPPSSGSVQVRGEVFPALTLVPGVVPRATCRQNIYLQGLGFGLKGQELSDYVAEVSKFSGLGDFLNSPYNTLSAGMKSRFAVSTLSYVKPELLFMDEWIGAADRVVLEKNEGLLSSLVKGSDIFVLASHRAEIVKNHCNKALVLDKGRMMFYGSVESAYKILNDL